MLSRNSSIKTYNKNSLAPFSCKGIAIGGDERDRTADPLLAKQVLSQLSYTPILHRHAFLRRATDITIFYFGLSTIILSRGRFS